jgi:hypothetical protein
MSEVGHHLIWATCRDYNTRIGAGRKLYRAENMSTIVRRRSPQISLDKIEFRQSSNVSQNALTQARKIAEHLFETQGRSHLYYAMYSVGNCLIYSTVFQFI